MDEPALRDIERWKDKIEVHLDNRQVFFLFFGSALVACMLFVLGVIVGKRIESRGRADAPEIQDPLAALDRVNQSATAVPVGQTEQPLTFPKALIGTTPKPKAAAPSPKVTPAPAAAPAPAAPPVEKPKAPAAAAAPPKPAAPVKVAAAPKPAAPAPAAATPPAAEVKPAARGKFTLQLSSFPDRSEADAFAKKFAGQGAFVITSEIPGKGTWYRVRVGNYASAQEASTAKTSFEKQHNIIAYVAAR